MPRIPSSAVMCRRTASGCSTAALLLPPMTRDAGSSCCFVRGTSRAAIVTSEIQTWSAKGHSAAPALITGWPEFIRYR